jgi:hypothetical protein
MSEGETRRRSLISFVEIFYFLRMAWSVFWLGVLAVIISEIYLYFSGAPRPNWLDPMETAYGVVWRATKAFIGSSFHSTSDSGVAVDPRCAVALVQFNNDGSEARRFSFNAKSFSVTPDVVTAKNVTWQKVQTAGYEGWAIKNDLDEKRSHSECQ